MKTFAMSNHFNPMDGFDRPQDFHLQARLLRECGFGGYYYNMGRQVTPEKILECAAACADEGIEITAMYWMAEVHPEKFEGEIDLFRKLLEAIPDGCTVDMGFVDWGGTLKPSSKEGLEQAAKFIGAILPDLQSKDCLLCPYPHFSFILESVTDAVALIQSCGRQGMGAAASGFHGHLAGEDWQSLVLGNPDLFHSVSLCGISKPGESGGFKIEPLGSGNEVDNAHSIKILKEGGYNRWMGVQGYSVQGHSRDLLRGASRFFDRYLVR